MTKLNLNSRIDKYSLNGKVADHDLLLDQAVKTDSDVIFNSLDITTNLTIGGNLTVSGSTTVISTDVVQIKDNIVELNYTEIGNGVTQNLSGLEVVRGSLVNQQMVFQENSDTWRIGEKGSSLQALATREDFPLVNGIMTWDASNLRLKSSNLINIPVTFSPSNSSSGIAVNTTSGAIRVVGGVGVSQDIYIADKLFLEGSSSVYSSVYSDNSNNLVLQSSNDIEILLGSTKNINIPTSTGITFAGTDSNKISGNSTSLSLNSIGILNFTGTTLNLNGDVVSIGNSVSETTVKDNLTVLGDLNISGGMNLESGLVIDTDSPEAFLVRKNGDSGDMFLIDSVNEVVKVLSSVTSTTIGTGALVVDGGVGIAENLNVGGALGVSGNITTASVNSHGNTTITNQGAHLQWNRSGSEGETWLINQKGGGNSNSGIRFGVSDASNGITEHMRIKENGNVGIGTINPLFKMDVNGTLNAGGSILSSLNVTGDTTLSGKLIGINSIPTISGIANISNITTAPTQLNSKMDSFDSDRTLYISFSLNPTSGGLTTSFSFSLPELTTITNKYDIISSIQGWHNSSDVNLENMVCLGDTVNHKAVVKFTSVDSGLHIIQLVIRYTV